MLDITMLGCGGMLPQKERWLSSCMICRDGRSILIDCGEGTQIACKCAGKRIKPVELICITHFHADHISGLPGFLLSIGNEGRTEPVTIAGPKGIERVVRSLCVIAPRLPFEIKFRELSDEQNTLEMADIKISSFRADHSVRCLGYTFELRRQGKFDPEKAKDNGVPMRLWSFLQKNGEAELDGKRYTFDMVGGAARRGLKFSYCTDSRPSQIITEAVRNSDLLICEGLYYDPDKIGRAVETGHMLYSEAAEIARNAQVEQLWLTHFSPAVKEPELGIDYARDIFPFTECGSDGKSITLRFPED